MQSNLITTVNSHKLVFVRQGNKLKTLKGRRIKEVNKPKAKIS